MKTWMKTMLCISLSLMCLFACIGYAALSGNLTITGTASIEKPPEGVFITNISPLNEQNVDNNQYRYYSGTTNIENVIRRGNEYSEGVVVYEVTIFNNTDTTYYYRDIYYQTELLPYNGNDYIYDYQGDDNVYIECVFNDSSDEAKKLEPQESIVFSVVYTVGKNIDFDLKMLVNIRFGIHVAGEREAIDSIEARFLKILNTPSTYTYLLDVLDNKYDGVYDWTSNYVGNVAGAGAGAFSDDSVAVNTLFQNNLQMTINDELREATVIIKHENVDGNDYTGDEYTAVHPSGASYYAKGCDMVLYLTIDSLDTPETTATVYVMVFTIDRHWATGEYTSDWYRAGTTYVGVAPVVDYVTGEYGTGSFQTTGWWPEERDYQVIAGYDFEIPNGNSFDSFHIDEFSYHVAPSQTNPPHHLYYILVTWREETPLILQHLMDDAKRILDNDDYAGEGIDNLKMIYEQYYWTYTYGTGQVVDNWTIKQAQTFHPMLYNLYSAINGVLTDISNES